MIRSRALRICTVFVPLSLGFVVDAQPQPSRARKRVVSAPAVKSNIPKVCKIRIEEEWLTAEIRVTPLHQVLEELAARTGVIFEVEHLWNPPVSVSLYRVSVQEAIQRIVDGSNAIFHYQVDGSGAQRVHFVRVFARNLPGEGVSLRYIGSGVATKTGGEEPANVEEALQILEASPSIEAQEMAIEYLSSADGEGVVEALLKALESPAIEIRVAAIESLGTIGAKGALPKILEALRDSHPGIRESAIEAVSMLGSRDHVEALMYMLKDDDGAVAAAAELAIRKLAESSRHPE